MLFHKIQYTTNFWLNNYLSKLDLLSKYKAKTPDNLPKLDKIILSLSLNKLAYTEKAINSIGQQLFYFYFYSLFNEPPSLKASPAHVSQSLIKDSNNNGYLLLLFFSTSKQIETFIHTHFIEAWTFNVRNKHKLFFVKKKTAELKLQVPLAALSNFNTFFNPASNPLIHGDSTLLITFKFKDLHSLNHSKSIKNIAFFWKYI